MKKQYCIKIKDQFEIQGSREIELNFDTKEQAEIAAKKWDGKVSYWDTPYGREKVVSSCNKIVTEKMLNTRPE